MVDGALAAIGDTLPAAVPGVYGMALVTVHGAYLGLTGVFEVTADGQVWHPVFGFRNDAQAWEPGPTALNNAAVSWYVPCAGAAAVRLRATALDRGPVSVSLAPAASVPLPLAGHGGVETSQAASPLQQLSMTVDDPTVPKAILPVAGRQFQTATVVGLRGPQTPNLGPVYLGVTSGAGTQPIVIYPGQARTLLAPPGERLDLHDIYVAAVQVGDGIVVLDDLGVAASPSGAPPCAPTALALALTVSTSAYSAGHNVGGLLPIANALRAGGPLTGRIASLRVVDHANQKAALDLLIFSALPAATFTNHAAFPTLTLADALLVCRHLAVAASDYATVGGTAFADLSPSGAVVAGLTTTLYAAIATTGTPTYAAATDLNITVGLVPD